MLLPPLFSIYLFIAAANAEVTVYGQIPFGFTSALAGPGPHPTLAAYNDTVLTPPAIPNPPPARAFTLELPSDATQYVGLSIPMPGSFFGFSIEMSVITQVVGKNSTHIHPVFLNLLGNLVTRSGPARVRAGGNTQEFAVFAEPENMPPDTKGRALAKLKANSQNPTETPAVFYSYDFFYMLNNISALVPVGWYLGIPMNETTFRLQIAEHGQTILGDNLLALQVGNEPDLYVDHHLRTDPYGPINYSDEVATIIGLIAENPNIPVKNKLIAPSVATGKWTPEQVWETGFLDRHRDSLSIVAVEHYPTNNCGAQFGFGAVIDPQSVFGDFLSHNAALNLVRPYVNSANIVKDLGKPFMMFETNTATCGGFPGISNSYGASLWALDYGMQMAASNFSGAMLHVGGQNVFYNPFTAPPTNETSFHQWTIGAVYYSALIMAEAFGKSGTCRIVDVHGNEDNIYTPQYAIYENEKLAKIALFNYITDPSGGSTYTATIHVNGGAAPSKVFVKYLTSDSVATKTNITWAGQTFGNKFEVDGRLKGKLNIVEIPCDVAAGTCSVPVQAPGFALVFLDEQLVQNASPEQATMTFATTAFTRAHNTATVEPEVLETSNGHSGNERDLLGSTSQGSASSAEPRYSGKHVTAGVMVSVLASTLAMVVPFMR